MDLRSVVSAASDPALPARTRLALCDRLVKNGLVGLAEPPLRRLQDDPTVRIQARRLMEMCRYLTASGLLTETENAPADLDGGDRQGVMIRRHPAAAHTILVFAGMAQGFFFTFSVLHKILRRHDAHIVYLRDRHDLLHMAGIDGLAHGYRAALGALRGLCDGLGAPRTVCIGNSSGGHAALRYGLDLEAAGVLAFSPPTTLGGAGHTDVALRALRADMPDAEPDLAILYAQRSRRPACWIAYGERNPEDAASALSMAAIPDVTLLPAKDYEAHDTFAFTLRSGGFDALMAQLLAAP